LAAHYRQLAQACEHITLIFDKGNNSEVGFEGLQATPFHFVGSLVPSQHPDLLAVPRRQFRSLIAPGLEQVDTYRTQKEVFGAIRTLGRDFQSQASGGATAGSAGPSGQGPP
jgi:transposase